jgi:Leucine-rich repeat (LRR) protein
MQNSSDQHFQHDIERIKLNDPHVTSIVFDFQNSVSRSRLRSLADSLQRNAHMCQITLVNITERTEYPLRTDHVFALEELLTHHHSALNTVEVNMDFASPVAALEFGKLIRRSEILDLDVSASPGVQDTSDIIKALAQGLATPPQDEPYSECFLTKLALSQFDMNRDAIDALCSHVIHHKESGINFVDLRCNNFTIRGDLLGEALFGPKSCLENLVLGGGRQKFLLGDLKSSLFSKLAFNNTLDTLLLVEMGHFPTQQVAALADALSRNTTLQELHIAHNNMKEEELMALVPVFQQNTSLQRLSLIGNNIGDIEAVSFGMALCKNSAATNLNHLALSDNCIGELGIEALAEMMCQCKTLKSLNLTNNEIDDTGAMIIAEAIGQSNTIEEVCLDNNNNIGIEGEEALLQSLRRNIALQRFSMTNHENDQDRILDINLEIDDCMRMNKMVNKLTTPGCNQVSSPAIFCDNLAYLTTADSDEKAHEQLGKVFSVLQGRLDTILGNLP